MAKFFIKRAMPSGRGPDLSWLLIIFMNLIIPMSYFAIEICFVWSVTGHSFRLPNASKGRDFFWI